MSSRSSIRKPSAPGSLCSALWMTPSHLRQSLRHGLCIRLKMRISTSPISKGSRTMGIRPWPSCSPAMALSSNYSIVMYDKSLSKVKIVQQVASELPTPPVVSYFLCDSWYTCGDIMDAFVKKGFYTIGALKTNRVLYPCGIKQKINEFALHLRKTDAAVSLVTVAAGVIMSIGMKGTSTALRMQWF